MSIPFSRQTEYEQDLCKIIQLIYFYEEKVCILKDFGVFRLLTLIFEKQVRMFKNKFSREFSIQRCLAFL